MQVKRVQRPKEQIALVSKYLAEGKSSKEALSGK